MTHLAARAAGDSDPTTLEPIQAHRDVVIGALRDRDITVRRQGLDLLYSMCDAANSQKIVGELLR
ncbi:hypothetical protein LTR53_020450, partial [Teratosphaeriaceae sp. CCFEE 6253]